MSLPPLANLLAVRREDSRELDALERALRADPDFDHVSRPAAGWLLATGILPGSEPDTDDVRAAGLAFAEGRDLVLGPAGGAAGLARMAATEPEQLARLPGDFGFLAFEPDGSVTAVRSAGGLAPIYVAEDGSMIGTRLGRFAALMPGEPVLDTLPNAINASGYPILPDGRTFLEGVRIVQRGRFVRLGPAGERREGTYWDPRPERLEPPTEGRFREHAERLRAILLERLDADLDPDEPNLLSLSGGIDSTSLLCLAAGTLGREVTALSLLPEPPLLERELEFIRSATDRAPLRAHLRTALNQENLLRLYRESPLTGYHCPHPILQWLPRALPQTGGRVLFGGEFGDEIGGSFFTVADWVRATSWWRAATGPSPFPRRWESVGRWVKWRAKEIAGKPRLPFATDLPRWAHPDVRTEYLDWLSSARGRIGADRGPLGHLTERAAMDGFVPMNWEAGSAIGVRRSFPFFNRDVLELAFDCHPAELVGPGFRRLIRAALAGDVPAVNLGRNDKAQWGLPAASDRPWEGRLADGFGGLIRSDWLPRPAGEVDLITACQLWQLARFAESVGIGSAQGG